MKLDKILLFNYLPYSKATIVARAISSIDGFKPVQRRVLYTMHTMGLQNGDRTKSNNIIGATMPLHPHGDISIYEAAVLMTQNNETLNVPYIDGKGAFGKVYSKELKYSAMRYTEMKLAPICKELFDGINENAVPMVDNYDASRKEPALLPVKFPNILVNTIAGVAVGTSSNIPSFSLRKVCKATIGVLDGTIKTPGELADVLGTPEFTTGGFVHASRNSLEKLCATGRGSFVISGTVETYNDRIVITEIPYCTTAEDIMEAIENAVRDKKIKGVKDVKDEIGIQGLRIVVDIKSGYNSREVLQELCRMTPLRTSISFRTRVIIGNRCRELGLLELLQQWIEFRTECVQNMYTCRLEKQQSDEHLLSTWDKIKDDIHGVVQMISHNTDAVAKQQLMAKYGLDDIQSEYLLDMKIRSITTDKAKAAIEKLADLRNDIVYSKKIISDKNEVKSLIIKELTEISDKYGTDNRTNMADELKEEDMKAPEIKISDELVTVVFTKDGFVRRLTSLKDLQGKFITKSGDDYEVCRWVLKNNQHILVFDRFGTVHKVLVDSIDSSNKAVLTDKLYALAGLEKPEDMIYADSCGDYTGYFNMVYTNGRGTRVLYSSAIGKRQQYKGLYDEVKPGCYWITKEDKFFMITSRLKAAYCDISQLGSISNRTAFKVARLASGDYFTRLQPAKDVPNIGFISLEKYNKDYTVSIGNDILWVDEEQIRQSREMIAEMVKKYNQNDTADNNEEVPEGTEENAETAENITEE